jgi:addiction module HigA family antidote
MAKKRSSHPGNILKRQFLAEYNLSVTIAAKAMRIPRTRLSNIVSGRQGISADTALRLGKFFGNEAQFWMNLQTHYDLAKASTGVSRILKSIHPVNDVARHA